ncbi:MAG: M1 family aminopeptidase, partial [Planctomycetota bacterium]
VVDFAAPSVDDRRRSDLSGRAPLVHDFTWTADPDFETRTATFRFADWAERFPAEIERARRAFGEDAPLELRDVTIEALIQPERAVQAERHVEATAAALFFYGLWFGEYPFERITVVDPAWGARAAGGMEYPTIFTAGTRLFTDSTMHSPESVTIHEAGHQWFYLLSANNEFEAAWLDEGLNSYADSEVIARVYGPRRGTTDYMGVPVDGRRLFSFGRGKLGSGLTLRSVPVPPLDWIGLDDLATVRPVRTNGILDWWRDQPLLSAAPERSDVRWSDRGSAINGDHADPIDTWAWRSKTRSSHYTNTYSRTATILRSMPAFLEASTGEDGDAAFLRAIRGFATEWRFRHPYPDDFFVAMEAHDGLDLELDWFFAELFRQVSTVDWRLDVREVVEPELLGATRGDDGRFVIAAEVEPEVPEAADEDPEAAGEEPVDQETTVPETVAADDDPDAGEERVWEIALEREGNLALPVLVRLNFENGTSAEFVWTRAEQLGERWLKVRYASRSPLVSAVVDPDGGYYLEQSRANNGWYADRGGLSVTRWTERIFAQAASFLRFQKGLGG